MRVPCSWKVSCRGCSQYQSMEVVAGEAKLLVGPSHNDFLLSISMRSGAARQHTCSETGVEIHRQGVIGQSQRMLTNTTSRPLSKAPAPSHPISHIARRTYSED